MPKNYLIQYKVRTVAHLFESIEVGGFTFRAYDQIEPHLTQDWVAEKTVRAEGFERAGKIFTDELLPIIDALSAQSQCAFSILGASFYILRLEQESNKALYMHVARDTNSVGMHLGGEDVQDVEKLSSIERPAALSFLREATVAYTAQTALTMCVIAAESLAGQGRTTGSCEECQHKYAYSATNREELEEILGDELYGTLYRQHGALRNKLFHGVPIDDAAGLNGLVYAKIHEYLTSKLGLKDRSSMINAPRTFANFQYGNVAIRVGDDFGDFDLKRLEGAVFRLIDEPHQDESSLEILNALPDGY